MGDVNYPRIAAVVRRLLIDCDAGADVRLGPFLQDITDEILASSSPGDRTQLTHSHASGSAVSAANAEPIGLIVGELVANAIQYAHPTGIWGRVDVSSMSADANPAFGIEVSDDGVGLPVGFDTLVDGGAGLEAVRQLAGQLGAGLRFVDSGVGLSVCLDLPFALRGAASSASVAS